MEKPITILKKNSFKLSDTIGNTPLVKLKSLSEKTGNNIYVKCEHLNPGGSVKDRTALGIIQAAIKKNLITAGSIVVEGTAGNTGIGLALLSQEFNYKCVIVMPNNQAEEKYQILRALGAELITVDPCAFTNQNHFYHTARKFSEDRPNSFWVNQFENTDNFEVHYNTTGPEIWSQLEGHVDAFISAVGTGGTLSGVSTFLKEKKSNVHIRMVDPMGSGLFSYFNTGELKSTESSITEGIGIMRVTENFKKAKIDSAVQINDQKMLNMFNYLCANEGLIVGTSAALNIQAAYEYAYENKNKNLNITTLICDSGLRYQSKVFNTEFLNQKGLEISSKI